MGRFRPNGKMRAAMNRTAALWLAVGWVGFAIIPWYAIYDGFWSLEWLDGYPTDIDSAPAVLQVLMHGRWWLAPIGLALLAPVAVLWRPKTDRRFATTLRAAGALGLAIALAQGFRHRPRRLGVRSPRQPLR